MVFVKFTMRERMGLLWARWLNRRYGHRGLPKPKWAYKIERFLLDWRVSE